MRRAAILLLGLALWLSGVEMLGPAPGAHDQVRLVAIAQAQAATTSGARGGAEGACPADLSIFNRTIPSGASRVSVLEQDMFYAKALVAWLDRGCGAGLVPEDRRESEQGRYNALASECRRAKGDGQPCVARNHYGSVALESLAASPPPAPVVAKAAGARTSPPASAAKRTGKPVWPAGMEPGNLYFAVEASHPKWRRRSIPIMISAASAQEAISRVEQAHAKMLEKTISRGETRSYVLTAGGECIGPAWGAVVTNNRAPPGSNSRFVWGGGCGKTPALAIEAAFAACRQKDPLDCDRAPYEDYWSGPFISLALSGRTSWSGEICAVSCMPNEDDQFGSFNAFTGNSLLSVNHIRGMQDAISKLGKQCGDRPCFYTNPSLGCYFTTPFAEIADKCTDTRLTPNGYSGALR